MMQSEQRTVYHQTISFEKLQNLVEDRKLILYVRSHGWAVFHLLNCFFASSLLTTNHLIFKPLQVFPHVMTNILLGRCSMIRTFQVTILYFQRQFPHRVTTWSIDHRPLTVRWSDLFYRAYPVVTTCQGEGVATPTGQTKTQYFT